MTYFKAFPARVPPSIDRSSVDSADGGGGSGLPLMLKADEPATLSVRVCGLPTPVVRWYIGPTLVQTDRTPTRAQPARRDDDGSLPAQQHSLTVDTVTDELEQGVTVVATNDVGQDITSFSVKTYKGIQFVSAVRLCYAQSTFATQLNSTHLNCRDCRRQCIATSHCCA